VKARVASLIVGALLYGALWFVAIIGMPSLRPILALPLILAILVGAGNWLNSVLGIKRKAQQFQERDGE
jgi:hypothetical protein